MNEINISPLQIAEAFIMNCILGMYVSFKFLSTIASIKVLKGKTHNLFIITHIKEERSVA
ncbi:hypothetical protein BB14905_06473 [Bacillus sp. B14905]|nr:hypothetical protein BB14905_06473 [Bacillus sp. B14905]